MANALALLSLRRLAWDYAGPCVRLRRSSEDAEQDFGFGPTGYLDAGAVGAWLGEDDGFVTTWYDQSGHARHATQATKAAQPKLVLDAGDGLPEIEFDGVDDYMVTGALGSATDTLHVMSVHRMISALTPSVGSYRVIYDDSGAREAALIFRTTTLVPRAITNNGTNGLDALGYVLGDVMQTSALYSPSGSHLRLNGASAGAFAGASGLAAAFLYLGREGTDPGVRNANVAFREFVAYTEAAEDEQAIEERQMFAWGLSSGLRLLAKTADGRVRKTADGRIIVRSRRAAPAPPAAPTGLSYDRSTGVLSWNDQPDATHFDVLKADGLHDSYEAVASGLTGTSQDVGLLSADAQAMLVVVARHARTGLSAHSRPIALSNLRL